MIAGTIPFMIKIEHDQDSSMIRLKDERLA
jgi:hypothetical protein